MYILKVSPEMGRGLYADILIPAGTVVCIAELLVLSEQDTSAINQTSLKYYTFKHSDTTDCLVLGDGEIFNHSDDSNVSYSLVSLDDRQVMEFRTLCDVEHGSQLFINYTSDIEVDVDGYIASESLI
jgi:hypothetical protein